MHLFQLLSILLKCIGDVDSAVLVYRDMCRKDFRPDALTLDMNL